MSTYDSVCRLAYTVDAVLTECCKIAVQLTLVVTLIAGVGEGEGDKSNVLLNTGNFGSSVASFFTFLRWLCALNLSLTILVFGFVILPQVLSLSLSLSWMTLSE